MPVHGPAALVRLPGHGAFPTRRVLGLAIDPPEPPYGVRAARELAIAGDWRTEWLVTQHADLRAQIWAVAPMAVALPESRVGGPVSHSSA